MKDPSFVAFATQKGGAGKTTLTVLTASYLYYVKKMKVLVVDCDYPQYSVKELRDRDLQITRINKSVLSYIIPYRNASIPLDINLNERTFGFIYSSMDLSINKFSNQYSWV